MVLCMSALGEKQTFVHCVKLSYKKIIESISAHVYIDKFIG